MPGGRIAGLGATRDFHHGLLGAVLAGLALGAAAACGSVSSLAARHVVLISLDTARADHFGFLGSELGATPRLDELARESVVFTDFMTVAPTTLASHTSLFTGLYPHRHGTPRNGFMVHAANEMLPEILRAAGFHTAGFAGSFALGSRFDFAQGFDHYDETFDVLTTRAGVDQNQRTATAVTDAVIEYLDTAGVPDRLLVFAHYFDPHRPYAPPAEFADRFVPPSDSALPPIRELIERGRFTPAEKARHAERHMRHYVGEIAYLDHELGRLVDALRARGVLDDALLILTSDHGEAFLEHREQFNHGTGVYQTTMRAVGLMRLPSAELGGTRVAQPTSTIDVLPTALSWLGLDPPSSLDGQALDLRDPERSAPRPLFGQATKPWESVETDPTWTNARKARFIRRGRFKLIQTPFRGTAELYDVVADPGEQVNLLAGAPSDLAQLADELGRQLEAWAASAAPLPSSFERRRRNETLRRLRSLGYLGSGSR